MNPPFLPPHGVRVLLVCLLVAAGSVRPSTVSAQEELIADPDDAARLHAWLDYRLDQASGRSTLAWVLFGGSLAVLGGGGVLLGIAASADQPSAGQYMIGGMSVAAGALLLGQSLVTLLDGTDDTLGLTLTLDGSSDAAEIARMETVLQLRAQMGRRSRIRGMVFGGVYAALGGAALAFLATSDLEQEAYLYGSAFAGGTILGGLLSIVLNAFDSDAERDWQDYRSGLRPPTDGDVDVAVSPLVLPAGGGLMVQGAF